MNIPTYTSVENETVFDDIQLLDDSGNVINQSIVAPESFAAWWCSWNGGSWRHRPADSVAQATEPA